MCKFISKILKQEVTEISRYLWYCLQDLNCFLFSLLVLMYPSFYTYGEGEVKVCHTCVVFSLSKITYLTDIHTFMCTHT